MRVGVVGASGFLGGEAVRLLAGHPKFTLAMACGAQSAGKTLRQVRAGLASDMVIQPVNAEALAEACDAVILALPHGESAPLAESLLRSDKLVVDLGSDFRLKDPAEVDRLYGREAPRQKLLDAAWYGLPEITGPPPPGTRLVACPGCFATALALLAWPLSGGVDHLAVFGVTGSSGSGIAPAPGVHHSTRSSGFVAYKPLAHQHMGELNQLLGKMRGQGGSVPKVSFIPHSAPVARGIHLTAIVEIPSAEVKARFTAAYAGQALIHVGDGPVNMGSVQGSCRAEIGISDAGPQTAVFVAIDNLLKGGAGQGLQNLNLLAGLPGEAGLPQMGMWP